MHKLGTMLRQELKMMCSDSTQSVLRTQSLSDNPTFSWSTIYSELQLHAPLLFNLLSSLTRTRHVRSNQKAVMCVCAAVLLKYRFPQMSLLQKVVSLIMYAGHASKQVNVFNIITLVQVEGYSIILSNCLSVCQYFNTFFEATTEFQRKHWYTSLYVVIGVDNINILIMVPFFHNSHKLSIMLFSKLVCFG